MYINSTVKDLQARLNIAIANRDADQIAELRHQMDVLRLSFKLNRSAQDACTA